MKISILMVILAVLCLPAQAQPPGTPTMEIVGPASFQAPVGHLLDERLRVRIRDAQGQPMPGITVLFIVDTSLYFMSPPPYGMYGVFITGDVPASVE